MSSMASGMGEKPTVGLSKSYSSLSEGKLLPGGVLCAESVPRPVESAWISIPDEYELWRANFLLLLRNKLVSPDSRVDLTFPSALMLKLDLRPIRHEDSDVNTFESNKFTKCKPLDKEKPFTVLYTQHLSEQMVV